MLQATTALKAPRQFLCFRAYLQTLLPHIPLYWHQLYILLHNLICSQVCDEIWLSVHIATVCYCKIILRPAPHSIEGMGMGQTSWWCGPFHWRDNCSHHLQRRWKTLMFNPLFLWHCSLHVLWDTTFSVFCAGIWRQYFHWWTLVSNTLWITFAVLIWMHTHVHMHTHHTHIVLGNIKIIVTTCYGLLVTIVYWYK